MTSRDEPPQRGTLRSITSLQNDSVKLIRSLDMRKARRETGLFVAEGTSLLVTAREQGWTPMMLVAGPGARDNVVARSLLDWALAAGAECLEVSEAVLEKLAAKDNPQVVMGVFQQRWSEAPQPTRLPQDATWLALEGVRDPGNLGTILRTADAVGAAGLLLVGQTCDPFSKEAVRASMGSVFAVPIVRMESPVFAALACAWPGDVIGTRLDAARDYRSGGWREPALVVMGSEGAGLSPELAETCRSLVKIPMSGKLDSLNLAVATALMLYEVRRAKLKI
jgi:RNA methyltransferase, TrmH family